MNRNPIALSQAEWDEIASIEFIRECWGLVADQGGRALAEVAYGTKFDYMSGSPGYCGDVYVLLSDVLGNPPVILYRDRNNQLVVLDHTDDPYPRLAQSQLTGRAR